jgi:hypothetical protein
MSSDQEIILDLYHALNQILTFTQREYQVDNASL